MKNKGKISKVVLITTLIVATFTSCGKISDSSSKNDSASSQISVSSEKEIVSSQTPVSSQKEISSSQAPVSSEKEIVSSQTPTSSKIDSTSSQNQTSTSTKPRTGIYKGIKWRSETAQPYNEKYGRDLLLVNNHYELTDDFKLNLVQWSGNMYIDANAYPHLKDMFSAASSAGVPLQMVSPYRSIELQDKLFDQYVVKWQNQGYSLENAQKKANELRTYAGTSEHNTGYACDILEKGNFYLSTAFENTAQFKWLEKNAQNYGFILRYPKDKVKVTEINYEPWHYRYVGIENAKKIKASGLCLEEYIDTLS